MESNKKKFCLHFDQCSGCQSDVGLDFPPVWKDVLAYFYNHGIFSVNFYDGARTKWRNRAKLAVRGDSKNPLIGLFKKGSHDVMPIPFCQIHYPEINQSVEIIRQLMIDNGLSPYNEVGGVGELRYLQFVVERSSRKVQVVFVLNFLNLSSHKAKKWQTIIENLGKNDHGKLWHSLWINLNNKLTNTIFGSHWILCYGDELLREQYGKITICCQPSTFAQANPDLFEKMLFRIEELVPQGAKVAEFYAGIGVIGLFLTHKSQWVRCAEINPHAEQCFSQSRNLLAPHEAEKISFHTGSAQDLLSIIDEANVAIVDPPRKGLDCGMLEALNKVSTLESLLYISCGWESFKRDCDRLIEGGWKLSMAEGYLFFPGSDHIEILAKFDRVLHRITYA